MSTISSPFHRWENEASNRVSQRVELGDWAKVREGILRGKVSF